MPQLLSRVRTPTNDLDTALEKNAKTAPIVRPGEALQAAQPTPGEKSRKAVYPCMQGMGTAAVSAYAQHVCGAHLSVGLAKTAYCIRQSALCTRDDPSRCRQQARPRAVTTLLGSPRAASAPKIAGLPDHRREKSGRTPCKERAKFRRGLM